MKWFLVVVSLISNHPGGHKDMWVVAKYYESGTAMCDIGWRV